MILTLKNEEEYIYAYAEIRFVDKDGKSSNTGKYVYVRDLWIHPKNRGSRTLNHLIREIDKACSDNVIYVYWLNSKQGKRISRLFLREKAKTKGAEIC